MRSCELDHVITYPVRLCSPAPTVERRAPNKISHLVGHASSATISPPIASPNLQPNRMHYLSPCRPLTGPLMQILPQIHQTRGHM